MPSPTFQLDLNDAARLSLSQAILIYRANGGRGTRSYASIHDVALIEGRPVIQAGKPATHRATLRLARALAPQSAAIGFLPENVLYADGATLVWWHAAQRRHIAFRSPTTELGQRSAVLAHPPLVFMVSGAKWLVWAHKGAARPTPESAMWQAPYFNVNGEGVICRGNVAMPTGTTIDKIGAWEDAFFRSYFTHPNLPKRLVRHRGGAFGLWLEMFERNPARFPQSALTPLGFRLGELVERHALGA